MFLSTERAGTNLCWMVQHLGDFKISLTSLGREEKKLYNVHIVQCNKSILASIHCQLLSFQKVTKTAKVFVQILGQSISVLWSIFHNIWFIMVRKTSTPRPKKAAFCDICNQLGAFQLAVANICGGKPDPGTANPSNCKRLFKIMFSHGCVCNKFFRRIGFFGWFRLLVVDQQSCS